jgi:hypothetical protein
MHCVCIAVSHRTWEAEGTWSTFCPGLFLALGETKTTWYVGHPLAYCISAGWWVMMGVEQSMVWLARETKMFWESLPQCHILHQCPTCRYLGSKPGRHSGKLATNCLSLSTISSHVQSWSCNLLCLLIGGVLCCHVLCVFLVDYRSWVIQILNCFLYQRTVSHDSVAYHHSERNCSPRLPMHTK